MCYLLDADSVNDDATRFGWLCFLLRVVERFVEVSGQMFALINRACSKKECKGPYETYDLF